MERGNNTNKGEEERKQCQEEIRCCFGGEAQSNPLHLQGLSVKDRALTQRINSIYMGSQELLSDDKMTKLQNSKNSCECIFQKKKKFLK